MWKSWELWRLYLLCFPQGGVIVTEGFLTDENPKNLVTPRNSSAGGRWEMGQRSSRILGTPFAGLG